MQCPACNLNATISKTEFKSDIDSTDIYAEQTVVCTNPNCSMHAGSNLNNPKKVIEVTKNKIN